MSNSQEQEALVRQLYAIYWEAVGTVAGAPLGWEKISIQSREAWIQVAQFVDARESKDVGSMMRHDDFWNEISEPDHK